MEQINRKADIEALYTLHGPTSVTVRFQSLCKTSCETLSFAAIGKVLTVRGALAGHAD